MTINNEITINLDAKKIVAITLLTILSVYTLYTYSTALYAFVAPTATPSIGVTTFNSYTTADVQADTFARGSNARIKVTLEKASAYNTPSYSVISESSTVKAIVNVYYEDGGVVKILQFYTASYTLQPGVAKSFNVNFEIPTDGVTGANYKATVFVWDTYLPNDVTTQIDLTNSAGTVPLKTFSAT